jgi:hypothetical protein
MKNGENLGVGAYVPVCQGSDCAMYGNAASDWFGDFALSEDVEAIDRTAYGDQG